MIELIAVLFTLTSVYLTVKENIFCWPSSIIGCIAYFFVFKDQSNFINMGLQVLFILQSIYGMIIWSKSEPNISRISKKWIYFSLVSLPLMSIFFYSVSHYFFGEDLVIDSVTTSLSVIATILLSHKILESWFVWIFVDFLYFLMFADNKLYLSAILYIVFLMLAVSGFRTWKNEIPVTQSKI